MKTPSLPEEKPSAPEQRQFITPIYPDAGGVGYMERVTSSDIAGAVSLVLIEDQRENQLSLAGLPQISVRQQGHSAFTVCLTWAAEAGTTFVPFSLSRKEAFRIAHNFKKSDQPDDTLFRLIQKAIAALEGAVRKQWLEAGRCGLIDGAKP